MYSEYTKHNTEIMNTTIAQLAVLQMTLACHPNLGELPVHPSSFVYYCTEYFQNQCDQRMMQF